MAAKKKKLTKEEKESVSFVTPEFRVSHPHVFKANAVKEGDTKKYSVVMLIPKKADLSKMKEALKQAKILEFGNKKNWPEDLESPVSDGDDPKYADKEGYKNHWVVRASTNENNRPYVVDENVEDIIEQSQFYPGCYAKASVFAYVWSFMKKQGVGLILDGVQKTKDGKAFTGKKSASQVFAPIGKGRDGEDDTDSDDDEEMDFR